MQLGGTKGCGREWWDGKWRYRIRGLDRVAKAAESENRSQVTFCRRGQGDSGEGRGDLQIEVSTHLRGAEFILPRRCSRISRGWYGDIHPHGGGDPEIERALFRDVIDGDGDQHCGLFCSTIQA